MSGFLIPLGECHLKRILREWVGHYNRGRPHSSLGPGIPNHPKAKVPAGPHRHKLPNAHHVKSTRVLGGLHHEYRWEKEAAKGGIKFLRTTLRGEPHSAYGVRVGS